MKTLSLKLAGICLLFSFVHPASGEANIPSPTANSEFSVNALGDLPDLTPGDGYCSTAVSTCTLRAAIEEANASAIFGDAADLITFYNIPVVFGVSTIDVLSDLPPITGPVTILGDTAPAELIINAETGTNIGLHLQSGASGSTIKAVTIGNFSFYGIWIEDADNVVVERSNIGISQDGTDYGNGVGIFLDGGNNTRIGGINNKGNVIGFNSSNGITINSGTGTVVRGNYIGTNDDAQDAGNGFAGISIYSESTTVGGPTKAYGNTIGFNLIGIRVETNDHTIRNNYVGTNEANDDLNNGTGIRIIGSDNRIGGSKHHGNIIGHNDIGILVVGENNKIKGNYIGTNEDDLDIGNGVGIRLYTEDYLTDNNTIGYTQSAVIPLNTEKANTIAYNNQDGIFIDYHHTSPPPLYNTIRGNHIYDNGEGGIDLNGTPGPDANDAGDADTGTNELLNYPDVVRVDYNGSFDAIGIEYSISSDPTIVNYPLTVDVYIADDPTSGEGKTFIGTDTYTTQNNIQLFDIDATSITWASTDVLVLTTTDADGNTSEFSPATTEIGGPGYTVSEANKGNRPELAIPEAFTLSAPYPNPFNTQTTFTLRLHESTHIELGLYNSLGQHVDNLHTGVLAGDIAHTFHIDGSDLASGAYTIQAKGGGINETHRIVVVK